MFLIITVVQTDQLRQPQKSANFLLTLAPLGPSALNKLHKCTYTCIKGKVPYLLWPSEVLQPACPHTYPESHPHTQTL